MRNLGQPNVTHSGKSGSRELVHCRVERLNPFMDWKKSWMAARSDNQNELIFLWIILCDILPTREMMYRMSLPDFSYSVYSGVALDIQSRKEMMCMAFCTHPSETTKKRKASPICRKRSSHAGCIISYCRHYII